MYALVEVSGKQYKVEKDCIIDVDKIDNVEENQDEVILDKVLLIADGENVKIGNPYLENSKVKAKNCGIVKGKKVRGIKFKKRKNYTRTLGHRQQYLQLKINEIIN